MADSKDDWFLDELKGYTLLIDRLEDSENKKLLNIKLVSFINSFLDKAPHTETTQKYKELIEAIYDTFTRIQQITQSIR
jgi:hypothetical protein